MAPLALFVVLVFIFSLVSKPLEGTIVTAPIVFTIAGMLLFSIWPLIERTGFDAPLFLRLAEIGLVLLLFTDASRTELNILRGLGSLPGRLVSVGTLLTIAAGTVVARLVFPQLSIWEAGILSAILAPTDAGLGHVIVTSPHVPMSIREALNVEAGLNDGLSVPFMLFFIALAAARIEGEAASLTQFIVEQLGYGLLVGMAVGLSGGWLMGLARRREWVAESFQQTGMVALPLLCLALSEIVGASMFIASFVAGLSVQVGFKGADTRSVEFAEKWGQLFNLSVFFIFGVLVVRDWPHFSAASWLYALLSLTVVRMLPVAIALIGTGLGWASILFMGWFGPRGLASIVLALVYLGHGIHLSGEPTIRFTVMVTVLLSIFVHGLSARPGIALYARQLGSLRERENGSGGARLTS